MTDVSNKKAGRVLLPNHVVPVRYDLELIPDLERFLFQGICVIELNVVEGTQLNNDDNNNSKSITLHAKELCIASAEYTVKNDTGSTAVVAEEIIQNVKATTVKFVFGQALPAAATIVLKIEYTGFINNQMAGFYRSSYQDMEGKPAVMASTQFESLDARRCFPCVDEPSVKAVFDVTLTVPVQYQVLSNMPEQCVHAVTPNTKKVSFLDTPIMSTYLLAFCVMQNFDSVQALTDHGVLVQVYTPPGKASSGQFALTCACKCLDAYNDFFGIHFPLPKLDLIAIPEFAMGAMENWGLVTYREVDLLIDPVTASSQQRQRVATVVNHELAHQWFGNLVTMAWWDDLWLNEGFASWAENWATDCIFPEYKMWDQYVSGALATALRLDALKSSHPIQVPIAHAEEVEQVFDAISYCKGGSVVKMIRAVLGMKHFQEGLSNYMKKFAYGNTETLDLWTAWQEVSGMPVVDVMASWTEQMGFPLLSVVSEDWQTNQVVLELKQQWFLSDGSAPDDKDNKKWTIPILTCTDAGTQEDMTLMRESTATVTVPLSSSSAWVKLNAGHEVPMRVLPGTEMLKRLAAGIQSKQLSSIDRAGLLNDAYALVKAGHQSPESLIELIGHYKDEDEYIVWQGLSTVLSGLHTIVSENDEMTKHFESFCKPIVLKLMEKVGWQSSPDDGHLTTLLRGTMIQLVSEFAYNDETVVDEARKRFQAFQEDPNDVTSLPSDMRTAVFKIILKNGGVQEYNDVKAYYTMAETNVERKHVLSSLGATLDPKLKLATMEWSTSGEIKLQDFFYAMGPVGNNKQGREITWQYFQDHLETKIRPMLKTANAHLMDAVIVLCAGGFSSTAKADELAAFFAQHPMPHNTRKIEQVIENMRANGKFLNVLCKSPLAKAEFWEKLK